MNNNLKLQKRTLLLVFAGLTSFVTPGAAKVQKGLHKKSCATGLKKEKSIKDYVKSLVAALTIGSLGTVAILAGKAELDKKKLVIDEKKTAQELEQEMFKNLELVRANSEALLVNLHAGDVLQKAKIKFASGKIYFWPKVLLEELPEPNQETLESQSKILDQYFANFAFIVESQTAKAEKNIISENRDSLTIYGTNVTEGLNQLNRALEAASKMVNYFRITENKANQLLSLIENINRVAKIYIETFKAKLDAKEALPNQPVRNELNVSLQLVSKLSTELSRLKQLTEEAKVQTEALEAAEAIAKKDYTKNLETLAQNAQKECQNLISQVISDNDEINAKLLRENDAMRSNLNFYEHERVTQAREIDELSLKNITLEMNNSFADKEINKLKLQVNSLHSQVGNLSRECQSLQERLADANRELNARKLAVAEAMAINTTGMSVQELQDQVQNLSTLLNEQKKANVSIEKQREVIQDKLKVLRLELDSQAQAFGRERIVLQDQINSKNIEKEQYCAKIIELENKIQQLEKYSDNLTKLLTESENMVKNLTIENNALRIEIPLPTDADEAVWTPAESTVTVQQKLSRKLTVQTPVMGGNEVVVTIKKFNLNNDVEIFYYPEDETVCGKFFNDLELNLDRESQKELLKKHINYDVKTSRFEYSRDEITSPFLTENDLNLLSSHLTTEKDYYDAIDQARSSTQPYQNILKASKDIFVSGIQNAREALANLGKTAYLKQAQSICSKPWKAISSSIKKPAASLAKYSALVTSPVIVDLPITITCEKKDKTKLKEFYAFLLSEDYGDQTKIQAIKKNIIYNKPNNSFGFIIDDNGISEELKISDEDAEDFLSQVNLEGELVQEFGEDEKDEISSGKFDSDFSDRVSEEPKLSYEEREGELVQEFGEDDEFKSTVSYDGTLHTALSSNNPTAVKNHDYERTDLGKIDSWIDQVGKVKDYQENWIDELNNIEDDQAEKPARYKVIDKFIDKCFPIYYESKYPDQTRPDQTRPDQRDCKTDLSTDSSGSFSFSNELAQPVQNVEDEEQDENENRSIFIRLLEPFKQVFFEPKEQNDEISYDSDDDLT